MASALDSAGKPHELVVLQHEDHWLSRGETRLEMLQAAMRFVQQHNPDPSAMHDLYPYGSGRSGIHHVALWVDDLQASIKAHEDAGHALALYAEMNDGFAFAMMPPMCNAVPDGASTLWR